MATIYKFNYQGPLFYLSNTPTATGLTATLDVSQGQSVPWTASSAAVPYRIYRSPVKAAATPLQLPASSVIDLVSSGIDNVATFDANGDVTILFAPNGSVDSVWIAGTQYPATQPIFLLVGKRERMANTFVANNADPATMTNYQDLTNLWVVLNPQTGLITSDVVAAQRRRHQRRSGHHPPRVRWPAMPKAWEGSSMNAECRMLNAKRGQRQPPAHRSDIHHSSFIIHTLSPSLRHHADGGPLVDRHPAGRAAGRGGPDPHRKVACGRPTSRTAPAPGAAPPCMTSGCEECSITRPGCRPCQRHRRCCNLP